MWLKTSWTMSNWRSNSLLELELEEELLLEEDDEEDEEDEEVEVGGGGVPSVLSRHTRPSMLSGSSQLHVA